MKRHLDSGMAAGDAARLVIAMNGNSAQPAERRIAGVVLHGSEGEQLRKALYAFDDAAAQTAFDRLLSHYDVESVLSDVVLSELRELGYRWAAGDTSIAEEHFVSNFFRGRLLGLARGWDRGSGRRAFLACPEDEYHDLPLLAFGVVLHRLGWRITYFGASTPIHSLLGALELVQPDIVVLSAAISENFRRAAHDIADLAKRVPVLIAGGGATEDIASATGARKIDGDSVAAAHTVAQQAYVTA
jgi:methanogenic corrinoid protein MtbC1